MKQKTTASSHLCSQFNWSAELSEILSSEHIHKEAKATGFVSRIRNLLPDCFFQLCCNCEWNESFPTLKRHCQWLREKFQIKILDQSLNERFTESAVDFMQRLMGKVSKIRTEERLSEFCGDFFSGIYIFDSTVQKLFAKCERLFKGCGGGAGANSSAIKIQFGFDLLSGNSLHLISRNGSDGDSGYRLTDIQPGSLNLFDLGYFSTAFLAETEGNGAFYLCRYRFGIVIHFEKDGEKQRLDLMKLVRKMKPGEIKELSVFLGEKDRVPSRFIIEKLPEQLAEAKRRKLKTDKQNKRKGLTKDRLEFCVVNAFVTNVPVEILSTENVRQIYTVRWQIEIVFKTWKSIFKLKEITNINPYRLACMFYGRLIRILIATRVFWVFKLWIWHENEKELSEIKSMKILEGRITELFERLTGRKNIEYDYWEKLKVILFDYGIKESRRKKPLPFQILRLFSLT